MLEKFCTPAAPKAVNNTNTIVGKFATENFFLSK